MKKHEKIYREAVKLLREHKSENLTAAYTLLKDAHSAGNHDAAYMIASWHLSGIHVAQSFEQAIPYLQFAIEGDIPEAYFDLAVSLETGQGTAKNERQAFLYYMEAALLGDKGAIYEVGRCFYHGVGVAADQELARVWLSRSEGKGE
ncbi:tetratricopeptide repeat protein [uncultured Chitinophaga sp.]|uniref:tetratricopeptide repeat protein n=1 Tax=uncultured Chitinophaga sp. TaxID=339340 RepID=UPI0025E154D9|nr:tetratricopeptide repeat protein [uncultured Chitinophaga sp.]